MRLHRQSHADSPSYPSRSDRPKGAPLATLVIGASITVAMALTACGKKEAESTSSQDTKQAETKGTTPPKGEMKTPGNNSTPPVIKNIPVQPRLAGAPRRAMLPGETDTPQVTPKTPAKLKDSDGDGVPDVRDRCPNVRGDGKDGCPLRKKGLMVKPRNNAKPLL